MYRWRRAVLLLSVGALLLVGVSGCGESAGAAPDEPGADEIAAWEAAAQERAEGKADTNGCSGTVLPDRGGFGKRIALTFDDGPDASRTPEVLSILAAHGAPATFFVNGRRVRGDDELEVLRQIAAAGHIIGNHSQNHRNLSQVSSGELREEVESTHVLLQDAGVEPRYFRFPFGAASCNAAAFVRGYGYRVTGWHIDSADWCYASPTGGVGRCDERTFRWVPDRFRDDMVGYIVHQAQLTDGGVLLFHDVHRYTVETLDAVLTRLESEGFTFVALDDADTFPLLNGAPPRAPAWIGTPCTEDAECDFAVDGNPGACFAFSRGDEDRVVGFCTLPCEGYCPDRSGAGGTFCTTLDGTTGSCVARAGADNDQCAAIPGTAARSAERFIGTTSARPTTVSVCLPD